MFNESERRGKCRLLCVFIRLYVVWLVCFLLGFSSRYYLYIYFIEEVKRFVLGYIICTGWELGFGLEFWG